MRFLVRPGTPDDLPELAERMTAAYIDNLLKVPLDRVDAEAVADSAIRQVLLRLPQNLRDNLIVHVAIDTETGTLAGGSVGYVATDLRCCQGIFVWVREEYRGRAPFTRALFRQGEAAARTLGANRIEIAVMHSTPRTQRLYDRLGYRSFSTVMSKPI